MKRATGWCRACGHSTIISFFSNGLCVLRLWDGRTAVMPATTEALADFCEYFCPKADQLCKERV